MNEHRLGILCARSADPPWPLRLRSFIAEFTEKCRRERGEYTELLTFCHAYSRGSQRLTFAQYSS